MNEMTLRERLMTVLLGGKADHVPLTIYQWVIPPGNKSFDKLHSEGLIPIIESFIYKVTYNGKITIDKREIVVSGNKQILTTIKTPVGTLTEQATFDSSFNSRWIKKYFINSVEDYKVMQYVYEHTTVEPSWDDYVLKDKEIGENGIVYGEILPIPAQWLMVEIMGTEKWCEGVLLHTQEFESLLESLTKVYKHMVTIAIDSPAEVIWLPDNLTGIIMHPDLFNKYCTPIYNYICPLAKQAGKITVAHYDGDNMPIKDCIRSVNIDVIEAFTPPPMGNMTISEAREAWPEKVISINVPGNIFHENAEKIERCIYDYMKQGGEEGKFIMGCTEDFPYDSFEHAFSAIISAMGKFEKACGPHYA